MADEMKSAIDEGANRTKSATDKAASAAKAATDKMRDAGEQARAGFTERVVDPAKRAREAFTAMREAAQAKDISDVMRIQGDYLREQSQRSMSQAREIGELIMQFGREAVAPLRGGDR